MCGERQRRSLFEAFRAFQLGPLEPLSKNARVIGLQPPATVLQSLDALRARVEQLGLYFWMPVGPEKLPLRDFLHAVRGLLDRKDARAADDQQERNSGPCLHLLS